MELSERSSAQDRLLASALRAYEHGRARWALAVARPLLALPLGSWLLSGHAILMCVIGGLLFATATVLLWRGQGWSRGVGLGVAAGLVPMVLAHASGFSGHVCTGTICMSVCLAVSLTGGIAAGLIITSAVRRLLLSAQALLAAIGVAFLTGALGCACIGVSGILGLAGGLGASVAGARLFTGGRGSQATGGKR